MGAKRISDKAIIGALRAAHGKLAVAAEGLGCSRETIRLRVKATAELQAVVDEEREGTIDLAESKLHDAINKGDPWAIQFCLKTIGRSRGYVERQELEHRGESTLRVAGLSREEALQRIAVSCGIRGANRK